ncbi:TetR/AcrR family transcriptional regulator [Levilactobacillus yiduensis]|uniref:TetR/AcrR family transcriptional regulator n=1 Tax=Levilactobacillus yiduensis TaxID=2953880 RepID=UPI000EF3401E|nr:TetR/AcrR family transcriptional regulator [Levilactobacillus yiduensis]AYM02048.1 TetR/AcrR family transcriptional regulator [Levilactobacillus brevis]
MATNQERKAQQRQGILAAAIELFNTQGFKPTHVKTVAQAAGVSQVTLYKYFDSKLELGHQVVIEMINQGYASFQKLIDDDQVPFPDIVKAMMANKVKLSDKIHPDFYQFVIDEMSGKNGSNVVKEAYVAGEKKFWDAVVARGRAAGMINPNVSDEALLLYLEMYVSYFTTANIAPEKYQRLVDQLMHLFFYGFAGVPATVDHPQPTKEEKS